MITQTIRNVYLKILKFRILMNTKWFSATRTLNKLFLVMITIFRVQVPRENHSERSSTHSYIPLWAFASESDCVWF